MGDAVYGSLPFGEQVAFFRRKLGNQIPTQAWTDLWQQEHDHAFMVAGANRADLLADFAGSVDRAISEGATLADFRKDFDAIVARHGWDYKGGRNWRSRVIYETNLRTSYAAGRWEQLQAVKAARPYWQYVHSDAVEHPRPLHQAWGDANLVLSADDPWWETHFPPNGWGCQCSVRALAERDLKRLGKTGPDRAPAVDMRTKLIGQRSPGGPREVQTPAGIDPGFAYAPGRDVWKKALLSRQKQQAGEAYRNDDWEPVLLRDARDYGRASEIPLSQPPGPPALQPASAQEMLDAVRTALAGATKAYDVKGLPVLISAQHLSGHIDAPQKLERGRFLPWLDDLMNDPFEVWVQLERHKLTGNYRIRAQIIKAYEYRHTGKGLLFVADQANGVIQDWTFVASSDIRYIASKRRGLLWWGAR